MRLRRPIEERYLTIPLGTPGRAEARPLHSLLITGASQLLTLGGRGARRGDSLSNLGLIEDGALLVRDGLIAAGGCAGGGGKAA